MAAVAPAEAAATVVPAAEAATVLRAVAARTAATAAAVVTGDGFTSRWRATAVFEHKFCVPCRLSARLARAVRVADRVQRVVRAPAEAPVVRVRLARVDPRAQEQVDQKVAIAERLAKLEPPEPAAIQGFAMAEVVAMDRPVGR